MRTSYVTSNAYFAQVTEVKQGLNALEYEEDPLLGAMAVNMNRKFDKYWGDVEKMNKLMFLGMVLDPRYKMVYLRHCFNYVYGEEVGGS